MTPASSGLLAPQMSKIRCSETWAWVEGNFVFHLFSSSFLKNVALVKANAEKHENKIKQTKSVGTWVRHFYIKSSNICDNPKSYFSKNVIFRKESVARLPAFPLKNCIVEKTFNTHTVSPKLLCQCSLL